jgi:amino acid transporter
VLQLLHFLSLCTSVYRQTIAAYPKGGGSYTVAHENLGAKPGLVAAAALLIDYMLNVAVGISAGVGALVSAVPRLQPYTLILCLAINDAVRVNPGDLVRMYFVNVGPGVSSAHVIGTLLDRVYDGKEPIFGVQTYAVPAGSGVMLEFYIPEEGVYPFVDHDKLAFLPYGLSLAIATGNISAMAH